MAERLAGTELAEPSHLTRFSVHSLLMTSGRRVLVGMSGGVDSSLSAALLLEQGFDVTGVFLKVWSESDIGHQTSGIGMKPPRIGTCPWETDLADARAVADQLGIELLVKNVQRAYWDTVITDFLANYQAGRTPNPDVLCNSQIKFGLLYEWALEQGFAAVATGHYAQMRRTEDSAQGTALHRGVDPKKDQTYFLWQVDRNRLKHLIFPIGHLTKSVVRAEAAARGLATATKRDSQGICFLGKLNVREWVRRELQLKPGVVTDSTGTAIGTHGGVQLYTIGQRHGFKVLRSEFGDQLPPHYVIRKDRERNELVVSPNVPRQRELLATNLNWLTEAPKTGDWVDIRIRHGQTPVRAQVVALTDHELRLNCVTPLSAVAAGQSVVLSRNSLILGGGKLDS